MSMLARYKKPGGKEQLVDLLENCGAKKKEMLVKTISAEDEAFAQEILACVLTAERVMTWDAEVICEAAAKIEEKHLAMLLKDKPQEIFDKMTFGMRDLKLKDVKSCLEVANPTPAEVEAVGIKLVQKVRELAKEGVIKLDEKSNPISSKAA